MPYTQLNNLDFTQIKTALKDYMRAQTDFTDYDFEGSALSQLLDVLAYNTYYTAFNTNMVVNELFLDSASLRDNVVALAKQLGYTPKSKTAPKAEISFNINFTGQSIPSSVTIKKGTGFVTNYDNTLYNYILTEDKKISVANGIGVVENLIICEGSYVETNTIVTSALKNQRFKIENPSADLSTLKVRVFQSNTSTVFEEYKRADSILDIGAEDKVYFISEIEDERYELFFGDGILGKSLSDGELVEISYVETNGPETNGAKTFSFSARLEDENNAIVATPFSISNLSVTSAASGGAEIESVAAIKYNAPKVYGAQNRAVTSNDYKAIVRDLYPAIGDIIVFGGEDQVPPAYGKVFIAIKPTEAASLSSLTKSELTDQLKKYTVASVKPEFIDPSILYIEIDSKIYYDSTKTNMLPAGVAAKASTAIEEYLKTSQTEKFNGKFRYSKQSTILKRSNNRQPI